MQRLLLSLALASALGLASADVYMHSMRGPNNRLNEQNVNRNNNNRLWDSQNNNKGGYSIGIDDDDYENGNVQEPPEGPVANGIAATPITATTTVTTNAAGATTTIPVGGAAGAGYQEPPLEVEVGALLPVEWTAQHACGPNDKTSCNVVIQYGCDVEDLGTSAALGLAGARDGEQTGCNNNGDQCPPLDNDEAINGDTNDQQFGQHEAVKYYQDCRARERNKGLFTADQNVGNGNNARARKTRQNPNGGRSGTECSEERDYYPYWHPTPYRDVAVLTSNVSRCAYYVAESQNTLAKSYCTNAGENNPTACAAAGGTWATQPSWDALRAADGAGAEAEVMCLEMFWSRDNHLGNGADGQPNIFNWTVPAKVTGRRNAANGNAAQFDRCVLRLRYNVSTGDGTDPAVQPAAENMAADSMAFWDLDKDANGNDSPVHQDDPTDVPAAAAAGNAAPAAAGGTDTAGDTRTLQLALNTNQYGRTFEDRSLVFHIVDSDETRRRRRLQRTADPNIDPATGASKKYDEVKDPDSDCDAIQSLTIRGKRGNIVQSYPGVEHDFEPSPLVVETSECMHLEMTLTDNDPPNNAGEGVPGTGRANFVLTETGDKNKPIVNFADQKTLLDAELFQSEAQMFRWAYLGQESIKRTNGGVACLTEDQIEDNNNEQNIRNCGKLNPVGPLYDAGYIKAKETGTFHYMSTRENNFSNRSHKGQVVVVAGLSGVEAFGIVVGVAALSGVVGAAGFFGYKHTKLTAAKGAAQAQASA